MQKNLLVVLLAVLLGTMTFRANSQSIDIGLLSTLELSGLKSQSKITGLDLAWHQKIDSISSISSFLNKVVLINRQKVYISLHTKSSMEDVIAPLKKGKIKYEKADYYIYQNVRFACYKFKNQSKYLNRIIFSEPKLTTVILIDYIDDRNQNKELNYKTIIEGLKLNSRLI
jgi:hypothetical protein